MPEQVPIKQKDAFAFIAENHRHHKPPVGSIAQFAVADEDGNVIGVAVSGRPVARMLDDGLTMEVTRLCTLGHPNACSMLYGMARKDAVNRGYRRGITYILATETGGSLYASGWHWLRSSGGGSWSRPSRGREDDHPLIAKEAFGWGAWPELVNVPAGTTRRKVASRTPGGGEGE